MKTFFSLVTAALLVTATVAFTPDKGLEEAKIKTSAICGMCKTTIEKALAYEKGVKSAELNVATKIVAVQFNPAKTNVERIRRAINEAGYDADETKANDRAYENLPGCCKKEAAPHDE